MARSTNEWQRDSCGMCVCVCVCVWYGGEHVSVGGVHMCRWKGRKKCCQVHEVKQQGTWLVVRMCVPSLRTTPPIRARKIWDYRG